jgi:hypothetical protein
MNEWNIHKRIRVNKFAQIKQYIMMHHIMIPLAELRLNEQSQGIQIL